MNATKPRSLKRVSVRQRAKQFAEMQRITSDAIARAHQASFLLCAMLAQAGGTFTITKGTLDQCMQAHEQLGFSMRETVEGKEFEVKLLYKDETPMGEQAMGSMMDTLPEPLKIAPIVITGEMP